MNNLDNLTQTANTSYQNNMITKKLTLQSRILNLIGKILITPYNWSLVAFTLIWEATCMGAYWNTNFDMLSSIANHIYILSIAAILIGAFTKTKLSNQLTKLGIINTLLVAFTLTISKAIISSCVGKWLFPITMFCFLLIVKNIWLLSLEQEKETSI